MAIIGAVLLCCSSKWWSRTCQSPPPMTTTSAFLCALSRRSPLGAPPAVHSRAALGCQEDRSPYERPQGLHVRQGGGGGHAPLAHPPRQPPLPGARRPHRPRPALLDRDGLRWCPSDKFDMCNKFVFPPSTSCATSSLTNPCTILPSSSSPRQCLTCTHTYTHTTINWSGQLSLPLSGLALQCLICLGLPPFAWVWVPRIFLCPYLGWHPNVRAEAVSGQRWGGVGLWIYCFAARVPTAHPYRVFKVAWALLWFLSTYFYGSLVSYSLVLHISFL